MSNIGVGGKYWIIRSGSRYYTQEGDFDEINSRTWFMRTKHLALEEAKKIMKHKLDYNVGRVIVQQVVVTLRPVSEQIEVT